MTDQVVTIENQAKTTGINPPEGSSKRDNTDRSAELFRLTLPVIAKHGRGFSPISYALWYEYVRRENQPLRTALDEIIANSDRITENVTVDLYQQHVVSKLETSIRDGQAGLLDLMDQVDNTVRDASQSAADLDSRLAGFADAFSVQAGTDEGRQQVSELKDDVLSMNAKMRDLQEHFEETRNDVKQMAEELAQTREQARRDPLTGLLNRRGFDVSLAEQIERATNAKEPQDQFLTLVLFDIDHFKLVNDTRGHLVGDLVIQGVAKVLEASVMRKDFVSRYGGEEFAIVLPTTNGSGGATVAERVRDAIGKATFHRASSATDPVTVTVSAGVAQYVRGESASDLTQRADQGLYRAKNAGRNQVCVTD